MNINPFDDDLRLGERVKGWVRCSSPVCATLSSRKPGPMAPSRTSQTITHGLAADSLFRDALGNLRARLEQLEKIDIGPSRFSALPGGCGFRRSSWWCSVLQV
jgi:hypothetical protein